MPTDVVLRSMSDVLSNLVNMVKQLLKDISRLNSSFRDCCSYSQLSENTTEHELARIESSVQEYLAVHTQYVENIVKNIGKQTVGELKDSLNSTLTDALMTVQSKLDEITAATSELSVEHANLSSSQLDTEQSVKLHQNMQQNLTSQLVSALTRDEAETISSGDEMISLGYVCGGTGGWRRITNLDMTDITNNCPSGWQLTTYAKRTCGRINKWSSTCDSTTFPVTGGEYSQVCGRVKAYQYEGPDAFRRGTGGLDDVYVDGVSITHGSFREHIWTFAAGLTEGDGCPACKCPCDTTGTYPITIPSFVGEDYFCESGTSEAWGHGNVFLYADDPLWDGEGCRASSTCCSFKNPPYFFKTLIRPTSNDVEVRICLSYSAGSGDIAVEQVELYVR